MIGHAKGGNNPAADPLLGPDHREDHRTVVDSSFRPTFRNPCNSRALHARPPLPKQLPS